MRTVKEISDLTGISVRTLHYYDEIGLLKPTEKSDAGYRLYDDKALETLQQILFFREFDISLKEIKAVLDNPALERNQILQVQRKMLVTKKERMERLIASIDDILKGENKMDFTIFTKTEVEEMFQTMLEHMPENMRNIAIKEFGSIEQWKKHYMEVVSSEEMQKGYAKVVEWYQGVVKSSLIAKNYVFRTPPLTILFFRRIRPRHSWEQLLQQSPHPSMQPLHPALRSSSVLSLQATSRYSHLESGIYDC